MPLTTTYLNERLQLLEGTYGEGRAAQLASLTRLYNRLHGPVTMLNVFRPELGDLSLYGASARHVPITSLMPDLMVKARPHARFVPGGGKGATPLHALLGALGEMAERLLATIHFSSLYDHLRYATHERLRREGRDALGPADIPLFAPEQYRSAKFPFVPFTGDTFLGWAEGRELLTGRQVLVPAQLVLMYYKLHPGEPAIGYATTAGLAFHTSRRQAILHGLHEVVERDCLNISWYSRLPPARVSMDLSGFFAGELGLSRARVSTPGVTDVRVLLNNLDMPVPVFTVIAIDRCRGERAFLGGSGAASRREDALAQALYEVGQCQTGFRFEDPFGRNPIYPDSDPEDIVEFFDAPLYFGYLANLPRTYWYTAAEDTVTWNDVPTMEFADERAEYAATMDWVRDRGLHPVVFDFGSACWPGAEVTKVFVPQLTQACPPANPQLGHPRFYELPKRLGAREDLLTFGDLNPDPVPFA